MFKLIYLSSVSACFELNNKTPYYSPESYKVFLDGKQIGDERKENVFSIFNLEPNTEYTVTTSLGEFEIKFTTKPETGLVDVKELGAKADGVFDDTYYVQMAIDKCPKGGRVLLREGTYFVRPIVMKSGITLELKKGATLLGDTLEEHYPFIKATTDEDGREDIKVSWEGEPFDSHQSFISAYRQKDFAIVGEGTIDGNAQNSTWWLQTRGRKVARPRLVFFNRCENVVLHGVTCQHSAAWNLHPFFSRNLGFYDLRISNPKVSPNTDGLDPESCDNVKIIGCVFSVGDDCCAIKSGKLYMGMKYKTPASNHTLRNNLFRDGHGAIVLGSEMSGGVKNLTVGQCIFENTDRGLRIKTRRGRGKYGIIDGVLFENIKMRGVLTPLVINMYYFCDPDGHTEAVWSRDPATPVDDGTPYLGRFIFRDIECTECECMAGYFDGLVEQPIKQINIENVSFSFKEDAKPSRPAMLEFVKEYSRAGLYIDNVENVVLKNVTFDGVVGDIFVKKNCGKLTEINVKGVNCISTNGEESSVVVEPEEAEEPTVAPSTSVAASTAYATRSKAVQTVNAEDWEDDLDYTVIDRYIDRLIDETTPDAPIWNIENIKHGKEPGWNYIDGCMMTSLYSIYRQTGDRKYLDFIDNFEDYYVFNDGTIRGYNLEAYNVDNLNEGRVLFDLYRETGKEKYRKAIELLHKQILEQPRTAVGNFWHKKIYPNQVWLDGLYMAQVFYTRYEAEFDEGKKYSDIVRQFRNVYDYMYDKEKKLYYHGWDYTKKAFWSDSETGLSKSFWLRAVGWYTVGLADAISYIDSDAHKLKAKLITIFRKTIEGLEQYIDPEKHMFWQVMDQGGREGNYLETSGSAMIAYAMMKGARLGYVDKRFAMVGKRVFNGIYKEYLTETDGELNLGGICLMAGLGPENNTKRDGTYEYYISEPVVENDAKGTGPFIMAYTELKQIKR